MAKRPQQQTGPQHWIDERVCPMPPRGSQAAGAPWPDAEIDPPKQTADFGARTLPEDERPSWDDFVAFYRIDAMPNSVLLWEAWEYFGDDTERYWDALVHIAERYGYKEGWACHQFKDKVHRWPDKRDGRLPPQGKPRNDVEWADTAVYEGQ